MIKKVTIDQLKPGMTIVKMASDLWEHLPGLYTKPGLIRSKEQVERIREAGYEQAFIEVKIPGEEPLEKRLDTMLKQSTVYPKQKKRVPASRSFFVLLLKVLIRFRMFFPGNP